MNTRKFFLSASAVAPLLLGAAIASARVPCENLVMAKLADTTITSAASIAAGQYVPSPQPGPAAHMDRMPEASFDYASLPAFCRVTAIIQTSQSTKDHIEIWMPADSWNGKMLVHTFRYYGGLLEPPMLADPVSRGYASVQTDLGSDRNQGAGWMYGTHEYVVDWAYRGWHEATVQAKTLMDLYYGRRPQHSYLDSCGGAVRSTLKEIEMYPDDYDAVSTSLHTAWSSHVAFYEQRGMQFADNAAGDLGNKVALLHQAAMRKCDGLDGLKDGVISDPEDCLKIFDPAALECKGADGSDCLTAAQVRRAHAWYDLVRNSQTGQPIASRRYPGTELSFNCCTRFNSFDTDFYRFFVFKDPNWTPEKGGFNFAQDVALADVSEGALGNAVDPNIGAFLQHGGKLLLIPGWSDVDTLNINYYRAVMHRYPKEAKRSLRMFMLPTGVDCPDGRVDFINGFVGIPQADRTTHTLDTVGAIDHWKLSNTAPDTLQLHEVKGTEVRDRLLCPYPTFAFYKDTGDSKDPANFVCKVPSNPESVGWVLPFPR